MKLAALALALPLLAPADNVPPTKKQRGSLAVLVQAWTDRLAVHLESTEKADLERALRKALYNQVSHRAEKDFRAAVVAVLAEDLGVRTSHGRDLVDHRRADGLINAAIADSGRLLNKYGFQRQHGDVLRHDRELLAKLGRVADGELNGDLEKGFQKMAQLYAERMVVITGETKRKKDVAKLLAEAFATFDTKQAVQAARSRARGVLRGMLRERNGAKEDAEVLALDGEVERKLPEAFPATFFAELSADHEKMLLDPKGHRKVLETLLRGGKRPAEDGQR